MSSLSGKEDDKYRCHLQETLKPTVDVPCEGIAQSVLVRVNVQANRYENSFMISYSIELAFRTIFWKKDMKKNALVQSANNSFPRLCYVDHAYLMFMQGRNMKQTKRVKDVT